MKKQHNIGNGLDKLKGKRPFAVPEQYFQKVPGKILHTIKKQEQQVSMDFRPKRRMFTYYLSAAAVVSILIIGYLGVRTILNAHPQDDMSRNEVMEYIDFYSQDLDESLIRENLDTDLPIGELSNEEKDAIVTFLLNEGVDELNLLDEL